MLKFCQKSFKRHCLRKCSRGQPIWLKLGAEVGCNEIFQRPIWLTSLTVSFGISGGSHFLPLEHQKSSLPGDIPNEFDHGLYHNRAFISCM